MSGPGFGRQRLSRTQPCHRDRHLGAERGQHAALPAGRLLPFVAVPGGVYRVNRRAVVLAKPGRIDLATEGETRIVDAVLPLLRKAGGSATSTRARPCATISASIPTSIRAMPSPCDAPAPADRSPAMIQGQTLDPGAATRPDWSPITRRLGLDALVSDFAEGAAARDVARRPIVDETAALKARGFGAVRHPGRRGAPA